MAIRLLEQHMAELIAAGEVVERPASVIKELVENAIDAGATLVQVEIEKGGIVLMRVTDNGSGIEEKEIPLAFLRHATSKVQTEADLDAIHTLGFRGEALPSIASVAQVELLSATAQAENASRYVMHGGQEVVFEPAARPAGTTITVENLFYNTPARMKFLKKDASEATFVGETVLRLALSNPQIGFRFVRDAKQIFQTPGDGKLESAVYSVLGAEFAKGLVKVENDAVLPYEATGLVTAPLKGRASRSMQFFYINGRFVKNRTMMAALEQAFRGITMHGKFPGCILFLKMPPELVDVNVHPAKTEVRFARESDVFGAVYKSVKASLTQAQNEYRKLTLAAPTVLETEPVISQAPPQQADVDAALQVQGPLVQTPAAALQNIGQIATSHKIQTYNELVDTLASEDSFVPYKTASRTQAEYALDVQVPLQEAEQVAVNPPEYIKTEGFLQQGQELQTLEQTQMVAPQEQGSMRLVGEIFKTYILAEFEGALCVIDKHAAHERMLYEQLIAQREQPAAQQLLAAVTVELSAEEKNALLAGKDALLCAGIEVDDFGGASVIVRSVPADIEVANVTDLIVEIAARLTLNANDTMTGKQAWVLHSVACRAAVKAGDKTPDSALLELARRILSAEIVPFCPHGRPVVLEITRKELEKQFGRLG